MANWSPFWANWAFSVVVEVVRYGVRTSDAVGVTVASTLSESWRDLPSWTKVVRTPISWLPQVVSAAGVTVQVTVALSPGARERVRVLPAGSADQPSGRSRRVLTSVTALAPVLVTVDVICVPSP